MRTYFPTTRLTELAKRSGGMARDEAVAAAVASLEAERGGADREIRKAITLMEGALTLGGGETLAPTQILEVMRHADQVVTLAGMFGYRDLETAAKSLCDIADGLVRNFVPERAPLAVHIQTLRLLAPGGPSLGAERAKLMLAELAKVTAHFNFGSLANAGVRVD